MRVDLFIARRLRLSDNRGNRTKTSIRISTAGVVLSVVVMLITIAVTSGFKHEIVGKLMGFDAQLTVQAHADNIVVSQPVITSPEGTAAIIRQNIPGAVVEESAKLPAMLKTDDSFSAVVFRGYGGTSHHEFIRANIVDGSMPVGVDSANSIVISSHVANQLRLSVGDKVNTCFFVSGKVRLRNFEIAAIYDSGFGEYDKVVAYAPLSVLKKIAGIPEECAAALEVSGMAMEDIPVAQQSLQSAFSYAYYHSGELPQYVDVDSILHSGAAYFNWLSLLDTNVVVILVLMTAISAFTLIASLIILILERVAMIGTLKMLGATNGLIRRVFILLDLKVLVKGLAVGNIIALTLILLQQQFHLLPLDPESYYIAFVPAKIALWQVLALNGAAIVVATAIMIIPSMMISRLRPATILRYE
ncbi:MAG: ABC transporter permease [Bacteroidales bacterium]|nr:ABC transporter permease [Bacteroidales bacterium]